MRSVPVHPQTGRPLVVANPAFRLDAILIGGGIGALVGGGVWALGRRYLGWAGVVLPLGGAIAGALVWNGLRSPG